MTTPDLYAAMGAFALARIDEEEQDAQAFRRIAVGATIHWVAYSHPPGPNDPSDAPVWLVSTDNERASALVAETGSHAYAAVTARHIARQHPPAVLARCKSQRELVARCLEHIEFGRSPKAPGVPNVTPGVLIGGAAAELLRITVSAWDWHDDYQEAWRP